MRTNKQIKAEISKTKSIKVRGSNEIEFMTIKWLEEEAKNSVGAIDSGMLIEHAFTLGYLRGMKHNERTEIIKGKPLTPYEPVEMPIKRAEDTPKSEISENGMLFLNLMTKVGNMSFEQKKKLAKLIEDIEEK